MTHARASQPWRLLLVSPRSGAENMARDMGLLDRARKTGEIVFSVYGWERPTLSLGRNQAARGQYDIAAAERRGVDIVRRPTGGRALLHDREITYSVTAPLGADESLTDSYRRFNGILLDGLRRLGVDVSEATATMQMPRPGTLPCFATPANGELVSNGAKLVGSAQLREDGALLQHGSILIEDDQPIIGELLVESDAASEVPAAATLSQSLGRIPGTGEVANALFEAVAQLEDRNASALAEDETAEFTAAHIDKYRSEWWTWRR